MLKKLYIQNYALIDSLEIAFHQGLSVVTGETGAGKSIILGAIGLILGQRADAKSVKNGTSRCLIEGTFDIAAYGLEPFFEENDLEYEQGICLMRRELTSTGKSRAFINDTPVTLAQMKELGSRLLDIHSQHQNLLLGDARFQLNVLDLCTGDKDVLPEYKSVFAEYKRLSRQLESLKEEAAQARQEEDYIRFQYRQLQEASLQEGELEELEDEQQTLTHAEEIKHSLFSVSDVLLGEERGILYALKDSSDKLSALTRVYPKIAELADRMQSDVIDLKDIASEIDSEQERVSFDSERSTYVQERLDTLYALLQKHRMSSVTELLNLQEQWGEKLLLIDDSDIRISECEKALSLCSKRVEALAGQLSDLRHQAADEFRELLTQMVRPLGMPNIRFELLFSPKPFDESGAEDVQFMFSANKNQPLQPVSETASGGEISRLMLCVKALIAGKVALPTIIFDEIDTGVSGEIADKMGNIMREMSCYMQVIAITHLPQVAVKGNAHYKVYKTDQEDHTVTRIVELTEAERVEEIARMLSGAEMTAAALDNARALLKNVQQKADHGKI